MKTWKLLLKSIFFCALSVGFNISMAFSATNNKDSIVHDGRYQNATLVDIATDSQENIVVAYVVDHDTFVIESSNDHGASWQQLYKSSLMFDRIGSISLDLVEADPAAPYPNMAFVGVGLHHQGEHGAMVTVALIA